MTIPVSMMYSRVLYDAAEAYANDETGDRSLYDALVAAATQTANEAIQRLEIARGQ